MELEQLIKRLDWMDDQRRKESGSIAALEERLVSLEGALSAANEQIKELSSEVTHLKAVLARVDQFESSISQHRVEFSRSLDEIERRRTEREREIEEVRTVQIEGVNKHLADLRKELEPIAQLQSRMQARIEEEYRLGRRIDELQQEFTEFRREDEGTARSIKLLEEGNRREEKKLTDIQGELLALRRRVDEHRGRLDLASDSLRKAENRLGDLATVESERREAYNAFYEKQQLLEAERTRQWREWSARFETIEEQAMDLEAHLQSLQTTQREIKKTQESVDDLIDRVERRINEITEMQRLGEDRFRQEWVTFKADDQKRWTNYTLSQEEQSREANRNLTRVVDQFTDVEDEIQELKDIVQQVDDQTTKRLQSLLALTRDWVADYERVFGRAR